MHALLGLIKFEALSGFNKFSATRGYEYSEHASIGYQPYLQRSGEKLITINVGIKFHVGFCNPELELVKLIACAKTGLKMPLLFGSLPFCFRGFYVIESITETVNSTDKSGKILEIEADLTLKEVSLNQIKEDSKALYMKAKALM